jgi:choline dehydrogenase-like flavoprotein
MMVGDVDTSVAWDVIVVGTGVGGATIGNALAQTGRKVLFLEKGSRIFPSNAQSEGTTPEGRLTQGWWPNPVSHRQVDGSHRRFFAAVGCALGGSSIHWAAALERLAQSDFAALSTSATPVPAWPVSYQQFLPYYTAAERLFGVGKFPLDVTSQRMSEWDRALMSRMRENGFRPEPLHVAIRYDDSCKECIGKICPRQCKADALVTCLDAAVRLPNCKILEQCDVRALEADSSRVKAVHVNHGGREFELTAKIVVLAAGAFHSPQLLLRSSNDYWPNGLANRSDQVGRNLMFHTSDILALWAPRRLDRAGRQKKSISVRDFYMHHGQRLGYVQSMGLDAGRGVIASFLKDQLRRVGVRNELLLSLMVKVPSHIGSAMFGQAGIFAAMTEDDPNPDNRITLDPNEPDGASFTYTITEDLRRRANALYVEFARSVRPWRTFRISPRLEMNYGHPCGTCRFGIDPAQSVLNPDCRAHDVENLYVVDASFMPRSGAVNPSLTIAANALRVAAQIAGQH